MNRIFILLLSLICFFSISGCNDSSKTPRIDLTQTQQVNICRNFIAGIFLKNPSIVNYSDTSPSGIIEVEYIRPDDGTKWVNVCDLQNGNNEIVWAAFLQDEGRIGRWRKEDKTIIHYQDNQAIFEIPQSGGRVVQVNL